MSDAKLYLGDCLDILPTLEAGSVDAVITDPPYKNDANYTRFGGGKGKNGRGSFHKDIIGSDKQFDPRPFLDFKKIIMLGFNNFPTHLPAGGAIVWVKRNYNALGTFLSDAEVAWMKGLNGVYVYQEVFAGSRRALEANIDAYAPSVHPNQKPIGLMTYCIELISSPGDTILDPFMGSGTTGVACVRLGRNFIGVEKEPKYYEIAKKRIEQAQMQIVMELA